MDLKYSVTIITAYIFVANHNYYGLSLDGIDKSFKKYMIKHIVFRYLLLQQITQYEQKQT